MGRYSRLRQILTLDPERDHAQIYHWMVGYEFPWDFVRALELALFRTYCVPSISRLLDATGEFRDRTQKRYDDTSIIVAEWAQHGYDSPRGREALERMNSIHAQFGIANSDYLYVLSTFIFEPIRWLDRFGWRGLSDHERLASYYFYRAVGERMHLQSMPPTYDAFERFNRDYERQHFRYAPSNNRVGESTRNLFASWFPAPLRPAVRAGIAAMLTAEIRAAFGFAPPPAGLAAFATVSLKVRGLVLRTFPPRHKSHFFTEGHIRTYPNGYQLADLGPPRFLERQRAQTNS